MSQAALMGTSWLHLVSFQETGRKYIRGSSTNAFKFDLAIRKILTCSMIRTTLSGCCCIDYIVLMNRDDIQLQDVKYIFGFKNNVETLK